MAQAVAAPRTDQASLDEKVDRWLASFQEALTNRDVDAAAQLFAPECYWRDLVSFTWNITTVEGRDQIAGMLANCLENTRPSGFRVTRPVTETGGMVEAWLAFDTAAGRGDGHLRLSEGGAWTLLTRLTELTGHEEPLAERRPAGVSHVLARDRKSWLEAREAERRELGISRQPYVVIIGGGQAGIVLGARLRQLEVPALVVDRHDRPGDQWRRRYQGLVIHDPVWYDHLPYLPFPENWPVFAPKDKLGDWLEMYTRVMEVPYWSRSEVRAARFDETSATWSVNVERDGETVTLHPKHLVFATGVAGKPHMPQVAGADVFIGAQFHSARYPGPDGYAGKSAVVIGSNNSAHDICGGLWEAGASVTMVQRSSSNVVKSTTLMDIGLGDLYSERAVAAGVTTDTADVILASLPYRILHHLQTPLSEQMAERDKDFYERLEAAGFWHDWGDDGSGLYMKYLRRGSGFYIDTGASDLIVDGRIALAHGEIDHLTEHAVVLDDGAELPADLVVYATGFDSMNEWVADIVDRETADRVGKVWGLGSDTVKDPGPWEGEERNMWKPTRQRGLWMHGGNLQQSRFYSLCLALQLKARHEGIATPVYRLAPVHHLR